MPHRLRRDPLTPNAVISIDAPENDSFIDAGGSDPIVKRGFHPGRNRDSSDVFPLADQVGDDPVLFPDLKVFKFQSDEFSPPQTASEQYGQHGAVALGAKRFDSGPLHQSLCLIGCEPVSNLSSQTLSSLYTPNSSCEIGTEEARVSRLVCQSPDPNKPDIYRRSSEAFLLKEESLSKNHGATKREARFRTVPSDALFHRVIRDSRELAAASEFKTALFDCSRSNRRKIVLGVVRGDFF
jgi:hypothetical protein